MSREIDERVVELRFDNKQFESATKESMTTLEKLKALITKFTKDSANSLNQLGKTTGNVNLSSIQQGVDALTKRFSTLGIVGMRVVQNLTDSILGKLQNAVGFLTNSIVQGGIKRAMNVENARFQLQSLLKDEERVALVMKNAKDSVDGTAYSYDSAAKAASMFASSGIKEGKQMEKALAALAGTAATTNSDYEAMALIFTQVAGKGRLMGDELLQLSTRGLNAAALLKDYVNGVNDGSIKASKSIKEMTANISGGMKLTEADIREATSKGMISFKLFAEAMHSSFGDAAKRANETFTGAFSNIKAALARIGEGFVAPLVAQNSEVIKMFNAIRVRVNDVKAALVFDEAIGNTEALSKQVTDSLLAIASATANFVTTMDISKPMAVFYNGLEIVKNLVKGLYSVVKPVGKAFKNTFLSFSGSTVVDATLKLAEFTEKLRLSDKASENLHDSFKGVFDIVKTGIKLLAKLANAFTPIYKPVVSLGDATLSLTGSIGRMLSAFASWVDSSSLVSGSITFIGNAINGVMSAISWFINAVSSVVSTLWKMDGTQKIIGIIVDLFKILGDIGGSVLAKVNGNVSDFTDNLEVMIPSSLERTIGNVANALEKLYKKIKQIDTSDAARKLSAFGDSIKKVFKSFQNGGLQGALDHLGEFFTNLFKKININGITKPITDFMSFIDTFSSWVQEKLSKVFDGLSFGSIAAVGGGFGLIKLIEGITKAFNQKKSPLQAFSGMMGALTKTISEFQKKIRTEELLNISKSIGILAAALFVLSLTDTDKVMDAAIAISMVAGVLLAGLTKLKQAMAVGNPAATAIGEVAAALEKGFTKIGSGIKWKLISSSIQGMAIAVGIIVASIAATMWLINKNETLFKKAEGFMGTVIAIVATIAAGMAAAAKYLGSSGSTNMLKISASILIVTMALQTVVKSLSKLLKIKLPEDYKAKVSIIVGLIAELGAMTAAIGILSKKFGNGKVDMMTIVAIAASLYIAVSAIKKLFKIDMPPDYENRIDILERMLLTISGLAATLTIVNSRFGGGKGSGTGGVILLAAGLYLVVLAVDKLMKIEFPKGWIGRIVLLGGILTALGGLAGILTMVNGAAGASGGVAPILAMCVMIATCVAAIGILATFPADRLTQGVIALGGILFGISKAIKTAAEGVNPPEQKAVLAMCIMIGTCVAAIAILGSMDFTTLLQGAIALGGVLTAIALGLKNASTSLDMSAVGPILAMCATIVTISYSLRVLANEPWDALLSGAASLSGVLLAVAAALKVIGDIKVDASLISSFLVTIGSLVAVTAVLKILAQEPWENILSAATAISAVFIAIAAATKIISKISFIGAIEGIKAMDIFIANLAAVVGVAGLIGLIPYAKEFLEGGAEILILLGKTLGEVIGAIVGGLAAGITIGLPLIAQNLADFAENAKPFFDTVATINKSSMEGLEILVRSIGSMVAGGFFDSISKIFNGGKSGLVILGENLEAFAPHFREYSEEIKNINPSTTLMAAKAVGETLLAFNNVKKIPKVEGLKEFGEALRDFSYPMMHYSANASTWNVEAITSSTAAVKEIVNLGETLKGTTIDEFGTQLVDFASSLADFAPNFNDYATKIVGLGGAFRENNQAVIDVVRTFVDSMPESGGIETLYQTATKLTSFGEEIVPFGEKMVLYGEKVANVSRGSILNSVEAIKALLSIGQIDVSAYTPGLMTSYMTDIEGVIEPINSFLTDMVIINDGVVDNIRRVAEIISLLSEVAPQTGGLAQWVSGSTDFETLGLQLVEFGKSLKTFGEETEGLNVANIQKALSMTKILAQIATEMGGHSLFDMFTGSVTVDEFGSDLVAFGDYLQDFSVKVSGMTSVDMQIQQVRKLCQLAKEVEAAPGKGFKDFGKALEQMASNGITDFVNAFQNQSQIALDRIKKFLKECCDTIKNSEQEFKSRGVGLMTSFATGFNTTINTSFRGLKSKMYRIGKYVVEGIREGINDNKSTLNKAVQELATSVDKTLCYKLEIKSPSRLGKLRGKQWDQGIAEGVKENASLVTNEVEELGDSIDNTLNSHVEAITADSTLSGKLKAMLDVIEAGEKEYSRIEEEAVKEKEEAQNKDAKTKKKVLTEEDKYWKNLLKVKKAGAEAERYQSMSVLEFEQDVLGQTLDLLKEYTSQLQSTRDSIMQTYDLFSEVTEQEAKTKEELVQNLSDQIAAFNEYTEIITSLNDRLGDAELGKYLQELGVSSLAQLRVINSMTDEELSNYAALYDQKIEEATKAASAKLSDLEKETQSKLESLYNKTEGSINLFDFSDVFDGTLTSVKSYLEEIMTPLAEKKEEAKEKGAKIGKSIFVGIKKGVTEESTSTITAAISKSITKSLEGQQEASTEVGRQIATNINTGIQETMTGEESPLVQNAEAYVDGLDNLKQTATSAGERLAKNVLNGIAPLFNTFYSYGSNAGQSFVDGIYSKVAAAAAAGAALANAASNAMKWNLDINSPSKVTSKYADYTAMGFIGTLLTYVTRAYEAGKELAVSTEEGMKDSFTSFSDLINLSFSDDPIIKPIVDTTNVLHSINEIERRFNAAVSTTAKGAVLLNEGVANSVIRKNNPQDIDATTTGPSVENKYEFVQNNYSPKALSRIDIYRQTNNQFSQFKEAVDRI